MVDGAAAAAEACAADFGLCADGEFSAACMEQRSRAAIFSLMTSGPYLAAASSLNETCVLLFWGDKTCLGCWA
jgi:hypothetical protein